MDRIYNIAINASTLMSIHVIIKPPILETFVPNVCFGNLQ